jgi:hypothetical protein
MAWWERSGDRSADQPLQALGRRSDYKDRLPPARPKIIFAPTDGLLGIEVDSKFVPAGPCCEDPLYCEGRECWRPFGPQGGVFGA